MYLIKTFPEVLLFLLHSSAPYQSQTGYAEASRDIIWTWAVVKVIRTSSNCWIAKFKITCFDAAVWYPLVDLILGCCVWSAFHSKDKAQTPEVINMVNIGAPRRKSGKFERVQYRNKPTFLERIRSWLHCQSKEVTFTNNGLEQRYIYLAGFRYTMALLGRRSRNIRYMQCTEVVRTPHRRSNQRLLWRWDEGSWRHRCRPRVQEAVWMLLQAT